MPHDLNELIAKAVARYSAMSPAEKFRHDYEQRRSFVRGMCSSRQDYGEWCKIVDRFLPPLNEVFPENEGSK